MSDSPTANKILNLSLILVLIVLLIQEAFAVGRESV